MAKIIEEAYTTTEALRTSRVSWVNNQYIILAKANWKSYNDYIKSCKANKIEPDIKYVAQKGILIKLETYAPNGRELKARTVIPMTAVHNTSNELINTNIVVEETCFLPSILAFVSFEVKSNKLPKGSDPQIESLQKEIGIKMVIQKNSHLKYPICTLFKKCNSINILPNDAIFSELAQKRDEILSKLQ